MIVYHISKIVCSWFVFALPLFRSFQALRRRPFSEPDVGRLMKYWIVIGVMMAFEYSVEGLISWFPFFWELKLLLLLFISLPQTQGSTYIYDTWLAPFLSHNESHFDQQIQLAQENFLAFFQSRVQAILDKVSGTSGTQAGTAEPPTAFQNAARTAMSFLSAHGLSLAGKGDAARPASSRTVSGSSHVVPSASASSTSVHSKNANHRASYASDSSQTSFAITPEQIFQSQSPMHSTPKKGAGSPGFPEPEHF